MANSKKYASLTSLQTFLDNLKKTFASLSHKHTIGDLTDYKVDSELSSTSTNPVQNKVLDAEFEAIATAMGALDSAIDSKANASHAHNDVYYTETEIDSKLAAKSDTTHRHDSDYDAKGSAAAVQENLNAVSDALDGHTDNADIHVTTTNKSNWDTAYSHSQAAHARVDATKVADSTINGNILINDTETTVYSHPNSGVTAGIYKSVTVNEQGHVTSGSNPTTLAGYGITDAETKTDASAKLTEAKSYADAAATKVKNDLLNNAGAAYDTLKELGDLIDDNTDAIDALETVAAGKSDKNHTHTITANAIDDNVVILTGTSDTNKVTFRATHAESGVTPGTYRSVTVNTYGHITGGSNPTTLSGYGITDAASKEYVDTQIEASNIVYVGPTEPTDPNIKVWINTAEEGTGVVPVLPRVATITLAANAWSGSGEPYSQGVEIATVTTASKVDLQPSAQQIVALQNAEISLMVENNGGAITCYAIGNKPTVDYTMQVLIQEVAYV